MPVDVDVLHGEMYWMMVNCQIFTGDGTIQCDILTFMSFLLQVAMKRLTTVSWKAYSSIRESSAWILDPSWTHLHSALPLLESFHS